MNIILYVIGLLAVYATIIIGSIYLIVIMIKDHREMKAQEEFDKIYRTNHRLEVRNGELCLITEYIKRA